MLGVRPMEVAVGSEAYGGWLGVRPMEVGWE